MIQNGKQIGASVGPCCRVLMATGAIGLAVALVAARRLEPDPRGYGTHEQLGLPPCSFRVIANRSCPSCGMTTAFVHVLRQEPIEAVRSNAAGALVALSCVALVPWSLASAAAGRLLGVWSVERWLLAIACIVVAVSLVSWGLRLLLF